MLTFLGGLTEHKLVFLVLQNIIDAVDFLQMLKIKIRLCPFSFSGEETDALACPGPSGASQASDRGWQVCTG